MITMTTRFGFDSGRLKLETALRRNDNFDDHSFEAKSASFTKAEKEIKTLKEENKKLRTDLNEIRLTLQQLLSESSHESFDERRVNLLKCQVIQLERQILLLTDAVGSRTESVLEVENVLCWLADSFRTHITAEVKGPTVPIERKELIQMLESTESARIKLFKNIENCSKQALSRPLMFMNKFIVPGREDEVTLLDIASGKLDHLNLKHIAQLESRLSLLYKELIRLHSVMSDTESANHRLFSCHVTSAARERLKTQILKSCAMMKGCADDLLSLSLLYPSAPWPVLKRPVVTDVSCEYFMASLPSLPRSKTQDVQQCVGALLKSCNYQHNMLEKQIKTLKNEIKFHQGVYSHQVEYMESLFNSLRDSYCSFEKSLSDVFTKPMKSILEAFFTLEETASEQALKSFLKTFKENKQQFLDAIEKFDRMDENEEGKEALSHFGEEYFQSLEMMVQKQQRIRDTATKEDEKLQLEQEHLDEELRMLLRKMEGEKLTSPKQKNINTKDSSFPDADINSSITSSGRQNVDSVSTTEKQNKNKQTDLKLTLTDQKSETTLKKHERDTDPNLSSRERNSVSEDSNSSSKHPVQGIGSAERAKSSSRKHSQQVSYKPNLQVAKATLQLRRAGSLSQLTPVRPQSLNDDSALPHSAAGISTGLNELKEKKSKPVLKKLPFK